MTIPEDALAVTRFWREAGPDKWFCKDEAFDRTFRETFSDLHWAAARRECESWIDQPESALALFILLDQYPRNSFRNTGHMYATDPLALHYCHRALALGHHLAFESELRVFFYLPLVHSEVLADQEAAVKLSEPLGGLYLESAVEHRDIIARFGRFPHRNPILGRDTTPSEQAFLDEGGFSG